ncbi:MAG TPA: gluconate 2-dehydrogenase subunit 3 family protein [Leadbetterella sp.]|nr:gluconate 2-dehydrogenase subunit 3 family protein [Leadbetterella sp.]
MKRRDALQRVALMMGGVVSAPTMIAILNGCKASGDATSGAAFSLTKDLQALVSEIAEVIIPKTDTPGAKDAGVGPFIEMMLKDCYTEAQQQHFLKGLEDVEAESKKLGSGFIALAADKKIQVIATMRDKAKAETESTKKEAKQVDTESGLTKENTSKKVEPPVPFFNLMKELTVFGFFTSEPGATKTLDFVPIPGRYEGCIKMEPGQKAYAI